MDTSIRKLIRHYTENIATIDVDALRQDALLQHAQAINRR
jgi:hypothetical protein